MADVMAAAQRSRLMSRVRNRNTAPERRLRQALWSRGLRYRLRCKLPGKPDLVFVSQRVAVFVDGCFWHCCPEHATFPKANADFWALKLARNVERDKEVTAELRGMGWTVLRFWEHEVERNLPNVVTHIANTLADCAP